MTESADIAIVSFDKFINGGDAEKRAVAKQLYAAFSTVGWVYLKDFGIPKERIDEIFGLVGLIFLGHPASANEPRLKGSSTFHCNRRRHGVSKTQK